MCCVFSDICPRDYHCNMWQSPYQYFTKHSGQCDSNVKNVNILLRFRSLLVSDCELLLSLQKYTHTRQSQQGTKPYYTSRLWWYGILLMGLGELGNFAAYGFAPASLIAPLGCVSVVGKT